MRHLSRASVAWFYLFIFFNFGICGFAFVPSLPSDAPRAFQRFDKLFFLLLSFFVLGWFQVPSVLTAGVPRGGEGVAEVPLHRRAPGHWQPVPAVSSGGFVHHRWEIPLLQPV